MYSGSWTRWIIYEIKPERYRTTPGGGEEERSSSVTRFARPLLLLLLSSPRYRRRRSSDEKTEREREGKETDHHHAQFSIRPQWQRWRWNKNKRARPARFVQQTRVAHIIVSAARGRDTDFIVDNKKNTEGYIRALSLSLCFFPVFSSYYYYFGGGVSLRINGRLRRRNHHGC